MKASEVLNRYANGERDFRRADLRGQNFKGQKLSGADFSEADIRGANFTNAILKEVNFTEARAGVQNHWLLVQQIMAFVLLAFAAVLSVLSLGIIQALLVDNSPERQLYFTLGLAALGMLAATSVAIVRQGFTFDAFLTITTAVAVTVTIIVAIIGAGSVVGVIAIAVAVTVATAGASAFVGLLFVRYYSLQDLRGDEKFARIVTMYVAFSAIGGTSFRGADLTCAKFTKAILRSTHFTNIWKKDPQGISQERETILEWVCWQDAKKLDYARVGNSILSNPAVRELLVTRNGYKKSYVDANFRASILDGANLEQANLTWADFSCSSLQQANLKNANLTEALVLNTDFTGAYFTGACLEDWNIDGKTSLEQADCQYVYLLRDRQERRPNSGSFAPGEFTKLFQEVLNAVDLIFRNGVDWKAFVAAFQQVQVENEDTPLEIQSIENKGDGVIVVRVSVPPDTNKEKIHSEFNQQYELAFTALEAKYRAELQAKEGEIAIYQEQSGNMWGVINSLANRPINVQAIAEAKAMNDSTDQSQNFKVGGNFNIKATNSVVNLRDISGSVTNTINQLPDEAETDQPNLKQLLIQLKEAIETDTNLPETDKADLLEQVQNLAEAKQTEEPAKKEGLVRKAKKMFEATLSSLPETAKIAEACSKLLPLILKVLGLPV